MHQQTFDEIHTNGQVVSCPSCNRTFDTERAMHIHHAKSHGESLTGRQDRFRCQLCETEVQTQQGFTSHLAQAHPKAWDDIQDGGLTFTLHE